MAERFGIAPHEIEGWPLHWINRLRAYDDARTQANEA
jgi:hypothetical protein